MDLFIKILIDFATLLIAISCLKNEDKEANSYSFAGLLLLEFVVIYNLFN